MFEVATVRTVTNVPSRLLHTRSSQRDLKRCFGVLSGHRRCPRAATGAAFLRANQPPLLRAECDGIREWQYASS